MAENLGLMSFLRKKLALKTKKPGAKNLGIYLKLEVGKLSNKTCKSYPKMVNNLEHLGQRNSTLDIS
jgi:hypothetical protein